MPNIAPVLQTQQAGTQYFVAERFQTTVNPVYKNPAATDQQRLDLISSFISSDATVSYWEQDPDSFDTFTMINAEANLFFTGKARVSIKRAIKIDKPRRQGVDGYRIISKGFDNAVVKVELTMWTQDQWKCYQSIAKHVRFNNLPQGRLVEQLNTWSVNHPFFQANGIDQVYWTSLSSPKQDDIGIYTFELEGLEWRPTSNRNRSGAVNASTSRTPPSAVPTIQNRQTAPSSNAPTIINNNLGIG